MDNRRGFLQGLVSLPLIGGGVTLVGRPAAAVPLVQAVAAPDLLADPRQRARYAWEAFAAAMRDVTAGSDGWLVQGGQRMNPAGWIAADATAWVKAEAVNAVSLDGRYLGSCGDRCEL